MKTLVDKSIKNVYLNYERYKANYSQSKQTGLLCFDVSISAPTIEELESESRNAISVCVKICNEFNTVSNNILKKSVEEKDQIKFNKKEKKIKTSDGDKKIEEK